MDSEQLTVNLDFRGGADSMFDNVKKTTINIKKDQPNQEFILQDIIDYLVKNLLKAQQSLFILDGVIRPGFLILRNNVDCELEGGSDCKINNNDTITIISTLHGG